MAFYYSFAAVLLLVVIAQAQDTTTTPVPILKQVNKVNDDGSYTYGFESADGSFRIETRDVDGNVKGKYGYIDETGQLRTIEYTSGKPGFEAKGDHLPVPVPALQVDPQPLPQAVPLRTVAQQPASFFPGAPVSVQAPAVNQVRVAPQFVAQPVFQAPQVFAPQPATTVTNQGFSFSFDAPAGAVQPQFSQFVPQRFAQQPLPIQSFVTF